MSVWSTTLGQIPSSENHWSVALLLTGWIREEHAVLHAGEDATEVAHGARGVVLERSAELERDQRRDPVQAPVLPRRPPVPRSGNEHLRLIAKQAAGCTFFVTQVVYDVNAAKDLMSDYRYECDGQNLEPMSIVFTFSACGSMKTLEFLRWLGVDVRRWIANELPHADDILDASYEQAVATAIEHIAFAGGSAFSSV